MKQKIAIVASVIIALLLIVVGLPVVDVAMGASLAIAPAAFLDMEKTIRGLKEERGQKLEEMGVLVDTAEKRDNKDFTEEEQRDYDALKAEADALERRYVRLEESLEARKIAAKQKGKNVEHDEQRKTKEETEKRYNEALNNFIRKGESRCSKDDLDILAEFDKEQRAMGTMPDEAGGYTVPTTMAAKIEDALKNMGGIRAVADIIPTNSGETMNFPTSNDVDEEGEQIDENPDTETTEKDIKFGNKALKAYTYSSKAIPVSNQLLQDSKYDIVSHIAEKAAKRIFKITQRKFTTGTGVDEPEGVLTAATKGHDAAATAITFDDLLKLLHSVVSDYRMNGTWMFNDKTLLAIRLLKDNDGKSIWQDGLRVGEPATILGKPYVINNYMPDIAANAKSIAFGDFNKYMVRDVAGASLQRLGEIRALKNQTVFVMFARHDGKLLDAGTNPIKYLQHAAA